MWQRANTAATHDMKRLPIRLCSGVVIAAFYFWLGTYGILRLHYVEENPWDDLMMSDGTRASKVIHVGFFSPSFTAIFRPLTEIDEKISGRKIIFSNGRFHGRFHTGSTAEF